MKIAIDTNILLDILVEDPEFAEQSKQLLDFYQIHSLSICPVVYAELLFQFNKSFSVTAEKECDAFLQTCGIKIVDFEKIDFIRASSAWSSVAKKTTVECPSCGHTNTFHCTSCKSLVQWRNHILSDHLIGAHAENHSDILLTRAIGFFSGKFKVKVMSKLR